MKILMVNKFLYKVGGSETYMFKLGESLEENGHDIQYFGMYDSRNIVTNKYNKYVSNIDFSNLNIFKKTFNSFKIIYSIEARKKISYILDKFKPDIVHLNNINFQITPSIIYEIKKRNIPIIQTVHDSQIACPNHRLYIEKKGIVCKKCLSGNYINCLKERCVKDSILGSAVATIESYYYHKRNTYNLIDKYICPSNFISNIIKTAGVEESRINVIYNFSEKFNKELIKYKKENYVLYFGRLSKEKGIETLLEVCRELPNINFKIVGDGPFSIQNYDLDNVEFLGFKSGDELKMLISKALFSVYPSEWYENCPLSIIESQNLGTPIVVSDLGGTKELVKSGVNGLIFKAGDKEELKITIENLFNDKLLLNKMYQNCIKNQYKTIDNYYKIIIKLYNDVIKNKA